MKHLFTVACFFLFTAYASAQNGDIAGKVLDESSLGIPFAHIALVDTNGSPLPGYLPPINEPATGKKKKTAKTEKGDRNTSDFDGNYSLKPLTPGKYNIQFSYPGYITQTIQGIIVNADKSTFIDCRLKLQLN